MPNGHSTLYVTVDASTQELRISGSHHRNREKFDKKYSFPLSEEDTKNFCDLLFEHASKGVDIFYNFHILSALSIVSLPTELQKGN